MTCRMWHVCARCHRNEKNPPATRFFPRDSSRWHPRKAGSCTQVPKEPSWSVGRIRDNRLLHVAGRNAFERPVLSSDARARCQRLSRAASNSRVRQSCMVCRQAVCRQAREAQLHWHAASRARRTAHCSCPRGHAYRTTSCGCGCEFPGVPVLIWTGGARNLVHWTGALRSARHIGRQRPCSGVAYARRSMCDAILRYPSSSLMLQTSISLMARPLHSFAASC